MSEEAKVIKVSGATLTGTEIESRALVEVLTSAGETVKGRVFSFDVTSGHLALVDGTCRCPFARRGSTCSLAFSVCVCVCV